MVRARVVPLAHAFLALGPLGNYYLSQTSAGQPLTSPAVDTGSVPSSDLGLDKRTTVTTSAPDVGTVDMGYHYRPVPTLVIERGTVASLLSAYRTVVDLPWEDDPGTLSDPAPPLLLYRIPAASQDIAVDKSGALDTVRLSWR
jgi:hypothetical protein